MFNIRTEGLPEDQNLVSSFDTFINQVKEQNHFSRVLQNANLVVCHYVLCLRNNV